MKRSTRSNRYDGRELTRMPCQGRAPWGWLGVVGVFLLLRGPAQAAQAEGNKEATPSVRQEVGRVSAAASLNSDYRVGPGDVLQVSVWREPEASSVVLIRPDGKISLPLLNDVEVSGKTPMEIQALVQQQLDPYINSPNVTVTVREVNSKKVYILGEVNRPGSYQMIQPTTVLQILTEAGGLRPFAKEKSIYVLRMVNAKQEKFPFNYKDVVGGKKMDQNIVLEPGDTVVVP